MPKTEDGADFLLWNEHEYRERSVRSRPRASDFQKESDKEWIERGGHLGAYIAGVTQETETVDLNLRSRQEGPERELWRNFFVELVKDATGLNKGVKRWCAECNFTPQLSCECRHQNGTPMLRCPKHFKRHTVQQCAINFIDNDPLCEQYCDMVGLSVSYLRSYVKKGVYLGKEFEKKRGKAPYQRLATKTLHPTRLPSEGGGAARPPEVGGEICGGETS